MFRNILPGEELESCPYDSQLIRLILTDTLGIKVFKGKFGYGILLLRKSNNIWKTCSYFYKTELSLVEKLAKEANIKQYGKIR